MNLTPEELAAIGSLDKPRTTTLASVGQFVIDLAVRIDAEGSVLSLEDLNLPALAKQLRELAELVEGDATEETAQENTDLIRYAPTPDHLDEVFLENVDVHIEQMADHYYWLCFSKHGDPSHDRLVIEIGSRTKRKAPVNGTVTENDLGVKESR